MPDPDLHHGARFRGRFTLDQVRAGLFAADDARGESPLVVLCCRAGEWGETRPPGIHYDDPANRRGPVIVFAGDEPPAALLDRFRPRDNGPGPLFITLGPEQIDPPAAP